MLADNHGTVWAPGVRDCSVQAANKNLIAESRSLVLTAEQATELRTATVAIVRAAGYRGVGSVEFLYLPAEKAFAFLKVNACLPIEHPVTEATTGLDLVKLQLLIADGERLSGEAPPEVGHAIEVHLNAEDADLGPAPRPGTVVLVKLPAGPGIRVDSGIASGDLIGADHDRGLAKVLAWGLDRSEALARLRCALRETALVVVGATTNKSFVLDLLNHPQFVSGEADAGWLDRIGVPAITAGRHGNVALVSAAINVYDAEAALERREFLHSARGGRPRASDVVGRTIELVHQTLKYRLVVAQVAPDRYRLEVDGRLIDVAVDRLNPFESRLVLGGAPFHVVSTVSGAGDHLVEVEGVSHRITPDETALVRAPAPAVVVALHVKVGDDVAAGATVAVLESMKMETAVRAPQSGQVREILASVNSQVDAGAPLLRLDSSVTEAVLADARPASFQALASDHEAVASDAPKQALEHLDALRAMITGYDVSAKRARTLVAEYVETAERACARRRRAEARGARAAHDLR